MEPQSLPTFYHFNRYVMHSDMRYSRRIACILLLMTKLWTRFLFAAADREASVGRRLGKPIED